MGKCKDLSKDDKGQILLDKQYRTKHIQNHSSGWVFFPIFFLVPFFWRKKYFQLPLGHGHPQSSVLLSQTCPCLLVYWLHS